MYVSENVKTIITLTHTQSILHFLLCEWLFLKVTVGLHFSLLYCTLCRSQIVFKKILKMS